MRFQEVTLLVPAIYTDRDPEDWNWTTLADSVMPIITVASRDVDKDEARITYHESGFETEAAEIIQAQNQENQPN